MTGIARLLIITGLVLVGVGFLLLIIKPTGFPRLPGDIYYHREGFSFYFPLGWCILLSLIFTLIGWISRRF